jgi:hypothetical protein
LNDEELLVEFCVFVSKGRGFQLLIEKIERELFEEWKHSNDPSERETLWTQVTLLRRVESTIDTEARKVERM